MTTAEKERVVESWPFPYPEYLELLRWSRDEKLKMPNCAEDEERQINAEYEQKLNRMFSRPMLR